MKGWAGMKQVLNESHTSSQFKIIKEKPANVLKRIQMKLSDWKPNRNGRIYPQQLWKNVVDSDYVREAINTHTLYGESSHPAERLEVDLANVSHAINDMWLESDGLWGTVDILPTPQGQIINTLIEYGSEIGISSRGSGSVIGNEVDPDDYTFVTFDIVMRPSVEAARLDLRMVESADIDINEVKGILNEYSVSVKDEDKKCKKFIYLDEGVRRALLDEKLDRLVESMK